MIMLRVFIAAVFVMVSTSLVLAEPTQSDVELFKQANDLFNQATKLRVSDETGARALYEQSIQRFSELVESRNIHSGPLYYNLANAYALTGDLGRAILNYRRAQRLTPGEPDLAANLSATRSRIATAVTPATGSQLSRTLLAWHYDTPPRVRFYAFGAFFVLAWIVLLARLHPRVQSHVPLWPTPVLLVLAGVLMGSLVMQDRAARERREAVIVVDSIVGRKGPDNRGYEPSFNRPLTAGVEVSVLESRPGWSLVRLGDGRETWLPEGAFEPI